MKYRFYTSAIAVLLPFALCGCANVHPTARPGSQVQADFTCRLGDGSLVETTLAKVAGDVTASRSPIFALRDRYRPLKFKVPEEPGSLQAQPFDPLEQKIVFAIANRITELPLGQTTLLELQSTPIEKFPLADRYVEMAKKFTLPRVKEVPIQEFESLYGSAAAFAIGSIISAKSRFPGVIREKGTEKITIYFSVREGTKIPTVAGEAAVRVLNDEKFEASMDIHEGQLIQQIGGLPGRVTAVDDKKFVIDFGQTFAGETLFCKVSARTDDPGLAKEQSAIEWIEDFDEGLKLARQQGKPVVLFLYSDECPYCQQMENIVFPDPSLEQFRNSFVWLKIISKKQTEFGERFKQQGYPLTLVLNGVGGEQERFSGLQHVTTLAYKLDHILSPKKKG
jgi:hypothetical protein